MKITGTGPVRTTTARRADATGKVGRGGFAAELGASGRAAAQAGTRSVEALDTLLSIQEVPGAADPGKRAAERGEDLLDRLDELRHALLLGSLPRQRLDQLTRMVRGRRQRVVDPRVADVLDEIELRCRVELAKLEAVTGLS